MMQSNRESTIPNTDRRQWVVSENGYSLGDLINGLTSDLATLLRQEVQLARAETMEKVSASIQSMAWMVAGGLVAYAGVIALLIAVIVGLAAFVPLWLSAAIVGIVALVIGFALGPKRAQPVANYDHCARTDHRLCPRGCSAC